MKIPKDCIMVAAPMVEIVGQASRPMKAPRPSPCEVRSPAPLGTPAGDRPTVASLVAYSQRGRPDSAADGQQDRYDAVVEAVREWKDHPQLQKLCELKSYVDQALRDRGQAALTEADKMTFQLAQDPNARAVARNAGDEWDSGPSLQRITSRENYIRQALRDRGIVLG